MGSVLLVKRRKIQQQIAEVCRNHFDVFAFFMYFYIQYIQIIYVLINSICTKDSIISF